MPWEPPARPDWVRAINRAEIAPITAEAALPLDRDALLGAARARMGLSGHSLADFGEGDLEGEALIEPLDRVLGALESEAQLTLMGRWLTRRFILRILEVRLQIIRYLREDPGVREERIEAPLFVAGAPRTGTTILYSLLQQDPAHRVPEGWELLRPVPPPHPDRDRAGLDPRIPLADRELQMPQTVVSGLLDIHPYSGRMPKECLSAMSFTFCSEEFTARYHVPSYEKWLFAHDMTDAYQMHRLVLQILQRRGPRPAWVLKSPVHQHCLDTLLRVYPDARIAVTHRDPLTVLASMTSLIAVLRWAHSDAVDYAELGASHAERYRGTFARLVEQADSGVLPAEQTHHSRYRDFVDDALGTVQNLYERFDRSLSSKARAAMEQVLSKRGAGEGSTHDYHFEDLGLDRATERAHHARYQARFDVPDET
jgi:hypothetical protein